MLDPLFFGIDVGGTNTKIGIVDDVGATLAYVSIPTVEEEGPQGLIDRAAEAIRQQAAELGIAIADIKSAGLGTPGPMDIPRGYILDPTNLPHWRHFPVRDKLSEALGMPVAFTNDANAAAYGEYWVGSGRSLRQHDHADSGHGRGGRHHCQRDGCGGDQQFWRGVWPRDCRLTPGRSVVRLGWGAAVSWKRTPVPARWLSELRSYWMLVAPVRCPRVLLRVSS